MNGCGLLTEGAALRAGLVNTRSFLLTHAGTFVVQAELREQSLREHEQHLRSSYRQRGLQPAPAAAAASQEAAGGAAAAAAAAADQPAREAQPQQQQQGQQQQGLQQPQQPGQQPGQQQQGQQPCGGDSLGAGAEGAPDTPTHLEMAPLQQQHSSSEGKEEQPQQVQVQERGAAEERQLLPLEAQQQHQRSSEGKEEQRQQVQLQE